MECKKQKKNSASLPRAMTKALGKEGSFAEGRSIALGKDSLKNSGTFLCRGPWLKTLGKDFF